MYTVYPAYLPAPTSSIFPNAPVRVLIVVPDTVALPAGTIVNVVRSPTLIASGTPTVLNTNLILFAIIYALSPVRFSTDRCIDQSGTLGNDTNRKDRHQGCLPTESGDATTPRRNDARDRKSTRLNSSHLG